MSAKSRRKGARIEREIVTLLRDADLDAQKVPLSGACGGSFAGDLRVTLAGRERSAEVKARAAGNGFRTLERWLGESDILFLRRDRATPLVVLPWGLFVELARGSAVEHVSPNGAPVPRETPLSDAAMRQWADFAGDLVMRLRAGARTYGDASFTRPPEDLAGEVEQELLDVCGWSFVLWTRIRALRGRVIDGNPEIDPEVSP